MSKYENASEQTVVKSRKQRQKDMAAAAGIKDDSNRPKKCKEAIDQGLQLFQEKQYQAAIDMFNLALELPGNGAYRLAGSPREFSCPSEAEENAALYNMACCYAQMSQKASCLTCLEAVLDNNFSDFKTLREDPDLAPVRGTELTLLLLKYDNPVKGLFGQGKKQGQVESDPNASKPWILW